MKIAARVSLTFFAIAAAVVVAQAAPQYVQIKKPLAPIYEYLDPKSPVIVQAKRGDHFELVYPGVSWYQVKVQDRVGWLERRAGEVVTSTSSVSTSIILAFIALLIGTFIGVFVFIQRQKTAEADI